MKITTKGRYGIRAVVNLARSQLQHPISISQIANEEGLSAEFLEQIFFKLKKAGVIRSVRGPKGGFLLNREPEDISLKTILDAVGEPIHPVPCTNSLTDEACVRAGTCKVSPVWKDFYSLVDDYFKKVTLRDILDRGTSTLLPQNARAMR